MPFRTYWSIVQEHCNFEIVEILHGWQVIGIHDQTSCPWSWKFFYSIILWDRVVSIMEGCRKRWEVWIQLRFILGLRIIHSLLFPRSSVLCSTPKLLLKAFYNLKFCCLDKSCLSLKNHNVLWLFFLVVLFYSIILYTIISLTPYIFCSPWIGNRLHMEWKSKSFYHLLIWNCCRLRGGMNRGRPGLSLGLFDVTTVPWTVLL